MKIRAGYDIAFQCPYAVPMVLMLTTHPSRDGDVSDQAMHFSPGVEARDFFDPKQHLHPPRRPARTFGSPQRFCRPGQWSAR